jgi:hypothetical protein
VSDQARVGSRERVGDSELRRTMGGRVEVASWPSKASPRESGEKSRLEKRLGSLPRARPTTALTGRSQPAAPLRIRSPPPLPTLCRGQGVRPGLVPQPGDPVDPGLSRLGMHQGQTTIFGAKPPSKEIPMPLPGGPGGHRASRGAAPLTTLPFAVGYHPVGWWWDGFRMVRRW